MQGTENRIRSVKEFHIAFLSLSSTFTLLVITEVRGDQEKQLTSGRDLGISEGGAKPSSGSLKQGIWRVVSPEAIAI